MAYQPRGKHPAGFAALERPTMPKTTLMPPRAV